MSIESTAKKRQAARDSLFLSAELTVEGAVKPVTVRVRNLSPGGMMVDGSPVFEENINVSADLRGVGTVAGKIAWVMDERAGVAFNEKIDPKEARAPTTKPSVLFTPVVDKTRRPGLKTR